MLNTPRKITTAEEAERLLDEQALSGLDRPTFCRRIGVDARSFNCWRLNLQRRDAKPARAATRHLQLVEVAWPGHEVLEPASTKSSYRLSVADVVLELDDAFVDETLVRLLAVVRSC